MHMYPWEFPLDAFEREKSCIQKLAVICLTERCYSSFLR